MSRYINVLISFFSIMCYCCSAQNDATIEYGTLVNGTYSNDQFDLSIVVPEEFYFMDKSNRTFLVKKNVEAFVSDSEISEKIIESTTEEKALIFAIFKFSPDTLMEVNPNMTITVMNISEFPTLKNIEHAVGQTIDGMREVNNGFVISEELLDLQINDKKFKGFNSTITMNELTAHYESYLGNYNDFNMLITVSYKTEIEKKELLQIVKGIKSLNFHWLFSIK